MRTSRKIRGRENRESGFTLLELLVVVAIVGVLAMIAIPNFQAHVAKSRQSEAKIALAAIYGGEKGFFAEYGSYAGSMDAIGYQPEGSRRLYAVGFADVHNGTINGYSGALTTASFPPVNNPHSCVGGPAALGAQLAGDAQSFSVVATGCVRHQHAVQDAWTIDDTKAISNSVTGI